MKALFIMMLIFCSCEDGEYRGEIEDTETDTEEIIDTFEPDYICEEVPQDCEDIALMSGGDPYSEELQEIGCCHDGPVGANAYYCDENGEVASELGSYKEQWIRGIHLKPTVCEYREDRVRVYDAVQN